MRINGFLSASRVAQFSRRLRFESLERRQLLTVTVDTLIDEADGSITDGDVSLRDAIANALPGETIDFSVTGTINLTLGQLVIFKDLTISGPGPGQLTIDAAGNDATPGTPDGMGTRIFLVNDFDSEVDLNVSIGGVTLQNGDINSVGGAIYSRENLTVTNVVLSDNVSEDHGGAIYSDGVMLSITSSIIDQNTARFLGGGGVSATQFFSLTITDSTISNNTTLNFNGGVGGGIRAELPQDNATILISGSTINSNMAGSRGGVLYFSLSATTQTIIINTEISQNSITGSFRRGGGAHITGGTISIESSRLSGNTATGSGGGAYLRDATTVTVLNTTIDANHSDEDGGGIYVLSDDVTISNSTVSGNTAGGAGGGIRATQGNQILHSTIVGNTSDLTSLSAGGGIYFGAPSDTTIQGTVSNSIVAGNFKDGGLSASDIAGTILADYNLIESGIGVTVVGPGNILGFDPMLGPLQDNGGPTPTHELLSGSPAIDAGDPSAVANMNGVPVFDQRGSGFGRVEDGDGMNGPRIDIGAYEVCGKPIEPSADFDGDGFITGRDFLAWQRGFGTTAPNAFKSDGDADNDLDVDSSDLDVWESQYGTAAPAVASSFRLSPQLVDLAMMMDGPEATLDSNRTEVDLLEPYLEVVPDSVSGAPLPQRVTAQPATASGASAEEERATEEYVAVLSDLVFSNL